MLDRVMQSGKRLLKEDQSEGDIEREDGNVQDFSERPAPSEQEREEFEDYVKHKVSSIRSNQDWLPSGLSVQVVSGKSVPKQPSKDRAGSKEAPAKGTVATKKTTEKSPVNTSSRSALPVKREAPAMKSSTNGNMPISATQKSGSTTVNGMPLRSSPINQSTKNYGLATPMSKRTNQQSARGSGVTSPRPAPHTPTRGGMQTPKQDSPISASAAGRKQLISVQEEFLKMHNRRQSTPNQAHKSPGQDSAFSNKYSTKDGTSAHLNSQQTAGNPASLQETLDIYKKYDFLKNGKVKITHKTAKFLTTRIKPADCVVHLLDSLFLLMGDNKLKLDAKIRFIEYKQGLAKVENVNDRLQQLFVDFKGTPDRYSYQVDLATKSLERFYTESVFSDLITLDYCKEILWISQGLIRFHNKCREGTVDDFTTVIDKGSISNGTSKHPIPSVSSRTEEVIKSHNDRLKHQQLVKKAPEALATHQRSLSKPEGDLWNRLASVPIEVSLEEDDRSDPKAEVNNSMQDLRQPMAHFSYTMDLGSESQQNNSNSISRVEAPGDQTQFSSSLRDRDPFKETGSSLADSQGPQPRQLINNRYDQPDEDADEKEYMSFGKGEVQKGPSPNQSLVSEMHKQKVREMLMRIQGPSPDPQEEDDDYELEPDHSGRQLSGSQAGPLRPSESPEPNQIRFYDRNDHSFGGPSPHRVQHDSELNHSFGRPEQHLIGGQSVRDSWARTDPEWEIKIDDGSKKRSLNKVLDSQDNTWQQSHAHPTSQILTAAGNTQHGNTTAPQTKELKSREGMAGMKRGDQGEAPGRTKDQAGTQITEHPVKYLLDECKQYLNMKSLIIIKNQTESDKSTSVCVKALLTLLSAASGRFDEKFPEDWKLLRARLGSFNLDVLQEEVYKPHLLLSLPREIFNRIDSLLLDYEAHKAEDKMKGYYSQKVVNFLQRVSQIYRFAKSEPKVYSEIHAFSLTQSTTN